MNIMAGGAIHLALCKAFTGGKQSILVSVNIQGRDCICAIRRGGVIIQGVSYHEGEGGSDGLPQAGMAKRAGVQSLLPAQEAGINNIFSSFFAGVGGVESYMIGGGPMASFTVNSKNDAAFVEYGTRITLLFRPDMGAMAFHALPMNLLVIIDKIVWKVGAVAPTIQRGIVGNG
jgi:hypothetical protein